MCAAVCSNGETNPCVMLHEVRNIPKRPFQRQREPMKQRVPLQVGYDFCMGHIFWGTSCMSQFHALCTSGCCRCTFVDKPSSCDCCLLQRLEMARLMLAVKLKRRQVVNTKQVKSSSDDLHHGLQGLQVRFCPSLLQLRFIMCSIALTSNHALSICPPSQGASCYPSLLVSEF